jgi:hypothetical protein
LFTGQKPVHNSKPRSLHAETIYGKEVVASNINCSGNLTLKETTVEGNLQAGQSIKADNAFAQVVTAGNRIDITNCIVTSLDGENITAVESEITANRCKVLGAIEAQSVFLDECINVQSIYVNRNVSLRQSTVQGDVSAQGDATISGSTINGRLTCRSNQLTIEGSTIDTIYLLSSNDINIRKERSAVFFHAPGATFDSCIVNISGGSINLGNPQTQSRNFSAENQEQKQILVLQNCTVSRVIFEGGKGEVIMEKDSILKGEVTGGRIRS